MSNEKHNYPYGWKHSCGSIHFQLDHPQECRFCFRDGEWGWYEESPMKKELKEKVKSASLYTGEILLGVGCGFILGVFIALGVMGLP